MYLSFLRSVLMILLILVGVAFLTLFERKVLSYLQNRKGPNVLGVVGVFQPFGDAIKLLRKEGLVILKSRFFLYFLCPLFSIMIILFCWIMVPSLTNMYYINYSVLLLFIFLRLGGYILILTGWVANSSFSLIGSIRFVSQSVSYEVRFILIIYMVILISESFSLRLISWWQEDIWNLILLMPIFLGFFIRSLFELNRRPGDLVEGESELVSGFNVEYFGGLFALIFLGEYGIIIFMSYVIIIVFTGLYLSGLGVFGFIFVVILLIYIRGVLPRIRYDELIYLCWKIILPIVLNYLFFIFGVKFYLGLF